MHQEEGFSRMHRVRPLASRLGSLLKGGHPGVLAERAALSALSGVRLAPTEGKPALSRRLAWAMVDAEYAARSGIEVSSRIRDTAYGIAMSIAEEDDAALQGVIANKVAMGRIEMRRLDRRMGRLEDAILHELALMPRGSWSGSEVRKADPEACGLAAARCQRLADCATSVALAPAALSIPFVTALAAYEPSLMDFSIVIFMATVGIIASAKAKVSVLLEDDAKAQAILGDRVARLLSLPWLRPRHIDPTAERSLIEAVTGVELPIALRRARRPVLTARAGWLLCRIACLMQRGVSPSEDVLTALRDAVDGAAWNAARRDLALGSSHAALRLEAAEDLVASLPGAAPRADAPR
jgi:hypothetical protein